MKVEATSGIQEAFAKPSPIEAVNCLLPAKPGREWRDIPGFEGSYMVSNDGKVASLTRIISVGQGRTRTIRTRLLKACPGGLSNGKVGALSVNLGRGEGLGSFGCSIGRLMLMAFEGDREDLVAHYKDGDPLNCTLNNLEWSTYSRIAVEAPNGGYCEDIRIQKRLAL